MNDTHSTAQTPADLALHTIAHTRVACLFAALGFAAALLLSGIQAAAGTRTSEPAVTASALVASADPHRFILNALLVPALDDDALPMRFVDPRPIAQCGPNTAVRMNGKPLVAGDKVPDAPFELVWLMDACRPFGAGATRFDGLVKLTVYREDWGFSATVEPAGLRITSAKNDTTLMRPRTAYLPQGVDSDDSDVLAASAIR